LADRFLFELEAHKNLSEIQPTGLMCKAAKRNKPQIAENEHK